MTTSTTTTTSSTAPGSPWRRSHLWGPTAVLDLAVDGDDVFAASLSGVFRLAPDGSWANVGPGLGPAFAVAVTQAGEVLAGTTSGVCRWNAGTGWSRIVRLDQVIGLHAGVNADGEFVLAATANDGVYRSDGDVGEWRSASSGLADPRGTQLVASRTCIVLGTQSGLYRSANAGSTWSPVSQGRSVDTLLSEPSGRVSAIADDRTIQTSDDDAISWTSARSRFSDHYAWTSIEDDVMCTASDRAGRLFVGTRADGVFGSDGAGWTALGSDGLVVAVGALHAYPGRSQYFISSFESGLLESTDAGDSWRAVDGPETLVTGVTHSRSGHLMIGGSAGLHLRVGGGWSSVDERPVTTVADVGGMLMAGLADGDIAVNRDGQGTEWATVVGPPTSVNQLTGWKHGVIAVTSERESNAWHHIGWQSTLDGHWNPIISTNSDSPMLVASLHDGAVIAVGRAMVHVQPMSPRPTVRDDALRPISERPFSAVCAHGDTVVAAAGSTLVASEDQAQTWRELDTPDHPVVGLIADDEVIMALSPLGTISTMSRRESPNSPKEGTPDAIS